MFKIQIIPGGEYLQLAKDSVVTVDLFGSMLNDESVLKGSASVPFKAPLNDHNKKIIRNAHLVTTPVSARTLQAQLWFFSFPWIKCELDFCITGGEIEGTLIIDNGIVANKLTNTKLNQVIGNENLKNFATQSEYLAYINAAAAASPGQYPVTFFPVRNEIWCYTEKEQGSASYPGYASTLSNYVNEWNAKTGSFVIDAMGTTPISHLEAPAFYLTYILKRVITYLGYKPVGDGFNDPDIARLVMLSPIGINTFGTVAIGDMFFYMPSVSLADFIKEVRNRLTGLLIVFNETDKTCLVDTWYNILNKQDATDLRPYQTTIPDDFIQDQKGYSITEKQESKDELFDVEAGNPAPDPLVIGDGSTSIDLAISTTKMILESAPGYTDTDAVSWRIPHVRMPFSTSDKYVLADKVAYKDRNSFNMRLLYFHGMRKNQAGDLYPYASADNLNWQGQPLSTYSLAINETTKTMVQRWYNFRLNSKKLQLDFTMPYPVFVQAKNSKRVIVRDDNNAAVICLMDQLSADLGMNEFINAQAVLYAKPITDPVKQVLTNGILPPVVDNGTVWVRLEQRNTTNENVTGDTVKYTGTKVDLYLTFWADQTHTVVKNVTNLLVKVFRNRSGDPTNTNSDTGQMACTGHDLLYQGGVYTTYDSQVLDTGSGNFIDGPYYTQSFSVVNTGEYSIIN